MPPSLATSTLTPTPQLGKQSNFRHTLCIYVCGRKDGLTDRHASIILRSMGQEKARDAASASAPVPSFCDELYSFTSFHFTSLHLTYRLAPCRPSQAKQASKQNAFNSVRYLGNRGCGSCHFVVEEGKGEGVKRLGERVRGGGSEKRG